ncbi:MAG: hypothetical protein R2856_32770 [Caldilineaceae bacterium]
MYQELMGDIRSDIIKMVMGLSVRREPVMPQPIARNIRTNRDDNGNGRQQTVRHTTERPGRNDPVTVAAAEVQTLPHESRSTGRCCCGSSAGRHTIVAE